MKYILIILFFLLSSPVYAGEIFEAVKKAGKLRCAYVTFDPALVKDPNTGALSGYDFDIMNAVADRLQLEVEFSTPTGWATFATDLETGKADMLCNSYWINPKTAKFSLFARPHYYQPVFIVARAEDTRFDHSLQAINSPEISIVALDGDNPVFISKSDFPNAEIKTLPNLTAFTQVLVEVATGKADVTMVDANTFGAYNASNPDKLKIVQINNPVRIYQSGFAFKSDEFQMRDAVSLALDELILDGTIDRILDQYEQYDHALYRVEIPYRNPYVE